MYLTIGMLYPLMVALLLFEDSCTIAYTRLAYKYKQKFYFHCKFPGNLIYVIFVSM